MAKTAKKPTKKKEKVEQTYLPDMAPPRIKALDDAAEIYFDTMQERVKLSKEEDEAKDNLIDKMTFHQLTVYETADGKVVTVTDRRNVKVKRKNKSEENGHEE